ncbi:hypothetical protein TNCV_2476981 [Trichonephila clavipes]|nr:hypothetical protein TNCV_2476981 [Trichonephila clavipes]
MFANLHPSWCKYGSLRDNRHREDGPRVTRVPSNSIQHIVSYTWNIVFWLPCPFGMRGLPPLPMVFIKLFPIPLQAMTVQMIVVIQVCFFKYSCEQCHLTPNGDVSDHGLLCKYEFLGCLLPPFKACPINPGIPSICHLGSSSLDLLQQKGCVMKGTHREMHRTAGCLLIYITIGVKMKY